MRGAWSPEHTADLASVRKPELTTSGNNQQGHRFAEGNRTLYPSFPPCSARTWLRIGGSKHLISVQLLDAIVSAIVEHRGDDG
jgi:hypothetical protein